MKCLALQQLEIVLQTMLVVDEPLGPSEYQPELEHEALQVVSVSREWRRIGDLNHVLTGGVCWWRGGPEGQSLRVGQHPLGVVHPTGFFGRGRAQFFKLVCQ